jgi:hypothetical protein
VSDISVSWLAVSRSAWRQRLLQGALGLTAGVAAALPLVLWLGSEAVAAIGGGGATCVGALVGRNLISAKSAGSWCLRHDGSVSIRWARATEAVDGASAVLVSSFLIVLRHGARTLEVWRDATPSTAFRRLSVAVRWHVARKGSVHSADRPDGAHRT